MISLLYNPIIEKMILFLLPVSWCVWILINVAKFFRCTKSDEKERKSIIKILLGAILIPIISCVCIALGITCSIGEFISGGILFTPIALFFCFLIECGNWSECDKNDLEERARIKSRFIQLGIMNMVVVVGIILIVLLGLSCITRF